METLVAETQAVSPPFGPPILPIVATEPADRPFAVALVLDLSSSMCGDCRVIDLFKESLVKRFANMEYDNIMYIAGNWCEDPGSAVAAIRGFVSPVRNLSASLIQAVKALSTLDRIYRRKVLLVTDQLSVRDIFSLKSSLATNEARLFDISFHAVAYGPAYSRAISESGWDYRHLDEVKEVEPILNEVCK
jgi:hypothetical protein